MTLMTPRLRAALVQFARNSRRGTCVECPRDGDSNVLPELCRQTERYDHQLDWKALVENIEHVFGRAAK